MTILAIHDPSEQTSGHLIPQTDMPSEYLQNFKCTLDAGKPITSFWALFSYFADVKFCFSQYSWRHRGSVCSLKRLFVARHRASLIIFATICTLLPFYTVSSQPSVMADMERVHFNNYKLFIIFCIFFPDSNRFMRCQAYLWLGCFNIDVP